MKGNGRACIKYTPKLSRFSPGKRPARFNPAFQVEHQDEPTTANPVRQHYKFAASSGGKVKYTK